MIIFITFGPLQYQTFTNRRKIDPQIAKNQPSYFNDVLNISKIDSATL
jgi:hypothetical protein